MANLAFYGHGRLTCDNPEPGTLLLPRGGSDRRIAAASVPGDKLAFCQNIKIYGVGNTNDCPPVSTAEAKWELT
ncbi:hypothetical protein ACQK5W_15890 [Pantoea sp. FN060301]|uniref:hypothetical protein n=1 Tax=Pantoea sp. FN060301 TaxID=3420380 RepID=UPI003D186FD5